MARRGGTDFGNSLRLCLFQIYKYASWLDQIEIWFSILQRKLLTPNDFPYTKTLKQRSLDFMKDYNRYAKPINWSYTEAQLKDKFATN